MPTTTCRCGRLTNSATSDFWDQYRRLGVKIAEVRPTRCYAAFVDGKYVRGCAFGQASEFDKKFALDIIGRSVAKK